MGVGRWARVNLFLSMLVALRPCTKLGEVDPEELLASLKALAAALWDGTCTGDLVAFVTLLPPLLMDLLPVVLKLLPLLALGALFMERKAVLRSLLFISASSVAVGSTG